MALIHPEQSIDLIQNPAKLAAVDPDELNQFVESYPFFELGHILLARKYKMENEGQYQRQLEKSAAFTSNRIWLKAWMEKTENEIEHASEVQNARKEKIIPIRKEAKEKKPITEAAESNKPQNDDTHDFLGWLHSLPATSHNEEVLIDPAVSNEIILLGQADINKELEAPKDYKITMTPEEEAGVEEKVNKSSELLNAMVSETLAEIFINKGNKPRAIEIYRQLSLNYPEKSDYFASRIQKLKEAE